MFGIANSVSEFNKWASTVENLLSIESRVNFMVAYASLERYLYRTALPFRYSKENIQRMHVRGYKKATWKLSSVTVQIQNREGSQNSVTSLLTQD